MINGVSSYGTQWQSIQTAQQRLSSADANGNSEIDIDEYLAVEEDNEKSKELFSKIDTDESGTLSESEISDYDTMMKENIEKMMSEAAGVIAKLKLSDTSASTTEASGIENASPAMGKPPMGLPPMGPPPSDNIEETDEISEYSTIEALLEALSDDEDDDEDDTMTNEAFSVEMPPTGLPPAGPRPTDSSETAESTSSAIDALSTDEVDDEVTAEDLLEEYLEAFDDERAEKRSQEARVTTTEAQV